MMIFLANTILLIVVYIYLWKYHKGDNISLMIALSVTGYTMIIPGLTFIDIFAVLLLILNFKKINKVSIFSFSLFLYIIYQIIINWYYYSAGKFVGPFLSTIIPVIHEYIPLFLIVLVVENSTINTKNFFEKYHRFMYLIFFLFVIAKIFIYFLKEPSMKLLIFTTGISGLIAILTPYWFAIYNKSKINVSAIIVISLSIVVFLLSETRGSLMIFIILVTLAMLPVLRRKYIFLVLPFLTLGIIYVINIIKQSLEIMSIINIQMAMTLNKEIDYAFLTSSERLRYILWTNAREVWRDDFLFGIGTNQFKALNILDREVQLSPHHAIYSIATDGGIIGVILLLIPVLVIMLVRLKVKTKELLWIKINAFAYLFTAFIFGYTLNLYILVFLYISYMHYAKCNYNENIKSEIIPKCD